MGLFDSSDSVPEKQTAWFDPYTNELLEKNIREGIASPEGQYKEIDKNLATGSETFGKLSTGYDDAIKNKYGRLLDQDIGHERFNQRLNVRKNQIASLKRGQQAMLALQAVQNDSYANYIQAQNLREEARSAAIKSITGAAGSVAGFGAAGGFSGKTPSPGAGGGSEQAVGVSTMRADSSPFARGYTQSMRYKQRNEGIGDYDNYTGE